MRGAESRAFENASISYHPAAPKPLPSFLANWIDLIRMRNMRLLFAMGGYFGISSSCLRIREYRPLVNVLCFSFAVAAIFGLLQQFLSLRFATPMLYATQRLPSESLVLMRMNDWFLEPSHFAFFMVQASFMFGLF